jgi:N-acetyl-anhydromuramyl-L-alanine amidase AmpD
MPKVRGIIVHQTDTETSDQVMRTIWTTKNPAGSVLRPNGAHFLIDKDGTIYQTALLNQQTSHVEPIQARCLIRMTCTEAELPDLQKWRDKSWKDGNAMRTHHHEKIKPHPIRYPSNVDSIGIECVGKAYARDKDGKLLPNQNVSSDKKTYDPLSDEQKESLRWLILALGQTLKVPMAEVFRHPVVGFKNKTEAISAQPIIDELQAEEAAKAKEAAAKQATAGGGQ